jgi:hypothetical protein
VLFFPCTNQGFGLPSFSSPIDLRDNLNYNLSINRTSTLAPNDYIQSMIFTEGFNYWKVSIGIPDFWKTVWFRVGQ